jgi:hypothetical protein
MHASDLLLTYNMFSRSTTCVGRFSKSRNLVNRLSSNVTTLTTKVRDQGKGWQRCGPRMKPGSHISCSQKCRKVWGNEPPHSQVSSHFGSWKSRWTFKFSEGNYRRQNTLDWKVPYIIGKLLELRCLKWVHMTHSGTYNISYGQKKGQESNCQFDPQPLKLENLPNFLVWRWRATYF